MQGIQIMKKLLFHNNNMMLVSPITHNLDVYSTLINIKITRKNSGLTKFLGALSKCGIIEY